MYYSTRVIEVKNFSNIFTGVSNHFGLNSTFTPASQTPLGLIDITSNITSDTLNNTFVAYQKDYYDYFLSKDVSKFKSCVNYFDNERCAWTVEPLVFSQGRVNTQQKGKEKDSTEQRSGVYYILNQMLARDVPLPNPDDQAQYDYSLSGFVDLSYLRISPSFWYLIVSMAIIHAVILTVNIYMLIGERDRLKIETNKLKSQ